MLRYCKITKIACYCDKKYTLTNTYSCEFKLLEDSEIIQNKESTFTWDNILEYEDEICQFSPWRQSYGLHKKKHKRFWINSDYLIRERFHPEMKVTLKYIVEEMVPSLDVLLKQFEWAKVYKYLKQQVKEIENN